MRKHLKIFLSIALCVVLIFCLSSCRKQKTYEEGYNDGYENGNFDANDALSDFGFEMYGKGYEEAYGDFVYGIIEYKAIKHARTFSTFHPEEAMCVIDCYEKGYAYCGSLLITDEIYKDAVESLYRYYDYFYSARYKEDTECDYEYYD